MTRKSQTRIGLLLSETKDGVYFHLTLRPVTIGATAEERLHFDRTIEQYPDQTLPLSFTIRNPREQDSAFDLSDLEVSSQGHASDAARSLYGWDVRYRDVYAVDGYRVKRLAKTLGAVERRLERLRVKYGRPESFGAYVARVAEALGADSIVVVAPGNQSSSYAENNYTFLSISDGSAHINSCADAWVAAGEPVTA